LGNNSEPTILSLSKYADCLVVMINQTGAIGSIVHLLKRSYRGKWSSQLEK